jgi:hypothetical protein
MTYVAKAAIDRTTKAAMKSRKMARSLCQRTAATTIGSPECATYRPVATSATAPNAAGWSQSWSSSEATYPSKRPLDGDDLADVDVVHDEGPEGADQLVGEPDDQEHRPIPQRGPATAGGKPPCDGHEHQTARDEEDVRGQLDAVGDGDDRKQADVGGEGRSDDPLVAGAEVPQLRR